MVGRDVFYPLPPHPAFGRSLFPIPLGWSGLLGSSEGRRVQDHHVTSRKGMSGCCVRLLPLSKLTCEPRSFRPVSHQELIYANLLQENEVYK